MGGGSWTDTSMKRYSMSKGRSFDDRTKISTAQNMFTERKLHDLLNPYGVIRECCDSEEHPATIPVILALDVTGSMGSACKRTATALGAIMSDLYKSHKDIEFLIMAIGDLAYDEAPIQASQFESDVRIAEAIDNIFFEGGGGGNSFESYTAAWYFGLRHTKLDCWKRGRKGIIITLGDEPLNPYLSRRRLGDVLGDSLQGDIETDELYREASEKFNIFHISVDDHGSSYASYKSMDDESWGKVLGDHYVVSNLNALPAKITQCIDKALGAYQSTGVIPTTAEVEPVPDTTPVQVNPDTGAIRW